MQWDGFCTQCGNFTAESAQHIHVGAHHICEDCLASDFPDIFEQLQNTGKADKQKLIGLLNQLVD